MQLSTILVFVSLLTRVLAQLNLGVIFSELPACSISCSEKLLQMVECHFDDIQSCFCRNTTLRGQLAACIQTSCNRTEQYTAISVSQNLVCKTVPQPSRSAELIRVVTILSAISFPVIILRIYSRFTVAYIWWDDWAIVAAGALMIPMSVIPIYNATRGFGKHVWDVPPENTISLQQLYYTSQILYAVVQGLAKISLLLLLLRIFQGKRFRLFTKIFIALITCHVLAFFMVITLQCIPISAIWDLGVKGKCINPTVVVFAGAGFSIFEDIVIMLLPVRELKGLNLTLKRRLAVIFMFACGSFACVTSMVRLKYIFSYQVQSLDATWGSIDVVIWSILEVYTAVICACLVAIRPLLTKYMPTVFQSTLAKSTYSIFRPCKMNPKPAGAHWSQNPESAIELKTAGSGKAWTEETDGKSGEDSPHENGRGETCTLEAWVTKRVQLGDEAGAAAA
ncbi:hypothetical protein VE01_07074 [Pseudogymnoascus verrucosus]|uniref:Uncharacterized protein n=1 Tax=Pseudogymnoascus verrucosus TaxID=342668 RepID=A0A1B8GDY4_9PEZI|nr:uncharacterized protein VE01_07074 [Pseudogymnoascus verrucosus]OBT94023.2 hypothetical protein VE01_07074 [Pseudogymnoascus verrucosus]